MRKQNWLLLIVGLLACGVIAAGCGDDGDSSSSDSSTAVESTTSSTESTTSEDTSTSTEDTSTEDTTSTDDTSSSSGSLDLDEFTQACLDTFSKQGVTGSVAESSCKQFTDQLQKCGDQADSDAAIAICQQIADQAVKQLQAGG